MRRGERSFRGHAESIRQPAYHRTSVRSRGELTRSKGAALWTPRDSSTRASKSSDCDDRYVIRRVPKRHRDRFPITRWSGDRSSARTADSHTCFTTRERLPDIRGYSPIPLFIAHGHRDWTSTRIPGFSRELRVFFCFFSLSIARDQIAGFSRPGRLFSELRIWG